jgi:hypothetical protein
MLTKNEKKNSKTFRWTIAKTVLIKIGKYILSELLNVSYKMYGFIFIFEIEIKYASLRLICNELTFQKPAITIQPNIQSIFGSISTDEDGFNNAPL